MEGLLHTEAGGVGGGTRSRSYRIATIPGDGIGQEVVSAARRILDTASARRGFACEWTDLDWGCLRYLEQGEMMPPDGIEVLKRFDGVFLGAIGDPRVPDHVSLWGLLIPIRRGLRQCVNLRPIRLLSGVRSPLATIGEGGIDFVCVRENNEGEYSDIGGRLYVGTEDELAIQEAVFTRRGVERVMHYAFTRARERKGRLASITKSNGIVHTMPFWDQICSEVSREYPDVSLSIYHADAAAALFVLRPQSFDVVVASNLFGDVLTDLGAAIVGSIGIAPSANLDPSGAHPGMFEPIHGSAPDIAGTGAANPIGQLWAGAMMLEHLGEQAAAADVMAAVEAVLASDGPRTPDLGGNGTTEEVTCAIIEALGV